MYFRDLQTLQSIFQYFKSDFLKLHRSHVSVFRQLAFRSTPRCSWLRTAAVTHSGLEAPLPVLLLQSLVSGGAAVLMQADEAVNGQTGGEQRGKGSAARRSGSAGSRGGLP